MQMFNMLKTLLHVFKSKSWFNHRVESFYFNYLTNIWYVIASHGIIRDFEVTRSHRTSYLYATRRYILNWIWMKLTCHRWNFNFNLFQNYHYLYFYFVSSMREAKQKNFFILCMAMNLIQLFILKHWNYHYHNNQMILNQI